MCNFSVKILQVSTGFRKTVERFNCTVTCETPEKGFTSGMTSHETASRGIERIRSVVNSGVPVRCHGHPSLPVRMFVVVKLVLEKSIRVML